MSHTDKNEKKPTLVLSLETAEHRFALQELRAKCQVNLKKEIESNAVEYEVPRAIPSAPGDQNIVALHRGIAVGFTRVMPLWDSKDLFVRMAISLTVDKKELPALFMTDCLALQGGSALMAVRMAVAEAACRKYHGYGTFASVMELHHRPDAYDNLALQSLGFASEAPQDAMFRFKSGQLLTCLRTGHYAQAMERFMEETETGTIPSWDWKGPRLSFAR